MSFSNYHMFTSKLENININNIYGMLNYELTTTEHRHDKVNEILREFDKFFVEYFEEYFKVELNKEDELATNNNICKMLEMLATYMLVEFGNKKKNINYNFYTDEEKFRKALKANTVDNLAVHEHEITTIDILVKEKNYRVSKKNEVTSSDLKRDDLLGVVLRDYEDYRLFLRNLLIDMLQNGKKVDYASPYKIRRILAQIKDDMNTSKDKLLKPITIEAAKGECIVEWTEVDYNNSKHIEALMYFPPMKVAPDSDLSLIVYDFHKNVSDLHKKCILKEKDLKLMNMMQQGFTMEHMAKILGLSGKSSVHKRISLLSNKIAKNTKN